MSVNMKRAISELKLELVTMYNNSIVFQDIDGAKRELIICKIEAFFSILIEEVEFGEAPKIVTTARSDWNNCNFEDRITAAESTTLKKRVIDFKTDRSRAGFTRTVFLLSKCHKLLLSMNIITRRELYYEHIGVFHSQTQVDRTVQDVCQILGVPAWELGVLATSKGLVAGPLVITMDDGQQLDCNQPGGMLVPQNVFAIKTISTCAQWILLIEKDAAFQKLVGDDGLSRLGPCIFLTGKGFPDVNTRLLLCKMWHLLQLPILAIVDADPHGIEIMCVYRFGSLAMSSYSARLACPAVRWLGLHPTDIKRFRVDTQPMTEEDMRKAQCLLSRPYVKDNPAMQAQLRALLEGKLKSEVEGVSGFTQAYLVDVYIPNKIVCKEYF